ncbi:MAG: hypothetical protein ACRDOE_17705 [Streptosporangiaceae bacterium]
MEARAHRFAETMMGPAVEKGSDTSFWDVTGSTGVASGELAETRCSVR